MSDKKGKSSISSWITGFIVLTLVKTVAGGIRRNIKPKKNSSNKIMTTGTTQFKKYLSPMALEELKKHTPSEIRNMGRKVSRALDDRDLQILYKLKYKMAKASKTYCLFAADPSKTKNPTQVFQDAFQKLSKQEQEQFYTLSSKGMNRLLTSEVKEPNLSEVELVTIYSAIEKRYGNSAIVTAQKVNDGKIVSDSEKCKLSKDIYAFLSTGKDPQGLKSKFARKFLL
jgi:hypothetical protein